VDATADKVSAINTFWPAVGYEAGFHGRHYCIKRLGGGCPGGRVAGMAVSGSLFFKGRVLFPALLLAVFPWKAGAKLASGGECGGPASVDDSRGGTA
jgi:hypothetical protein